MGETYYTNKEDNIMEYIYTLFGFMYAAICVACAELSKSRTTGETKPGYIVGFILSGIVALIFAVILIV